MINVVDIMRLQPESEHPHGLSDREFDSLFTADKPVVFAYHGYPWPAGRPRCTREFGEDDPEITNWTWDPKYRPTTV